MGLALTTQQNEVCWVSPTLMHLSSLTPFTNPLCPMCLTSTGILLNIQLFTVACVSGKYLPHTGTGGIFFLTSPFWVSLNPWKGTVCILTTPGLPLGSKDRFLKIAPAHLCSLDSSIATWLCRCQRNESWLLSAFQNLERIKLLEPTRGCFIWMITQMTHKGLRFSPRLNRRCLLISIIAANSLRELFLPDKLSSHWTYHLSS